MKIICISAAQVPSDTANSIQVVKVCQAYAQLGHKVTLLVPGQSPSNDVQQHLISHYGLRTLFNIEWLPVQTRRTFHRVALRRARELKVDLLHAWPVQSAVLGLLARLPVLLEMHDLPTGTFGPLWYRLFCRIPGKKRLLPITHALRRKLEQAYPASWKEGESIIAPDGVDLERYENLPEPETARTQLGLAGGQTVECTGHLYAGRGADLFLTLAGEFPRIHFLWVGGRPQEVEAFRSQAKAHQLENVLFTGFIPNEHIPLYQAAADILLMPYDLDISGSSGGNTADICSPMKMFEYMAAGRAIITSDLLVLHEVLNDNNAIFCPVNDAGAWENAMLRLLDDDTHRITLGQNARRDVQQYSWVERAKRILEGFNE